MNPLITQALQNSERAFDAEVEKWVNDGDVESSILPTLKERAHQSNLELLAAVRETINNFPSASRIECENEKTICSDDLLTALSEGNKNNI